MTLKSLILFVTAFIFLPINSYAQDKAKPLEGYVPPPMFGAPRALPPKKAKAPAPKMPRLSKPAKNTAAPKKEKPKAKAVIPLKKPEHPKVNFKTAPLKKVPEKGHIEKNNVKPGLEPIDLIKNPTPIKLKPVKKKTSQGVVKGPKTMPAVKKQGVDTEILFEPKIKESADLMNNPQQKSKKTAPPPPVNTPKRDFTLPSFKVLADGNRKLNLVFSGTQDGLDMELTNTLDQLIIPLLKEKPNIRLRLESYASPQEGRLNGDRRIALSRVMAIREHITSQGVSANRLDVRSLGAQTDIHPMDRVEIFLVK